MELISSENSFSAGSLSFRFNPWKHHLQWIVDLLCHVLNTPDHPGLKENFIRNIRSINSNYVDIYAGNLTSGEIITEISCELKRLGVTDKTDFGTLLSSQDFLLVSLSDGSRWVLREGLEDAFYVHIHPARNGPLVARIHGNSWKTVVVCKLFYPQLSGLDQLVVNRLRSEVLELSPIKDVHTCVRLRKASELLMIK
ncbi:MAG TPA: hypothetical protein PKH79_00365 [Prolixibacteraceae bacterium]|nr:hypothetical protein [Prolixibacteraceae bacterium]HPS13645.1 hypothetical protein [Prolixibacteraceae bacterium]